MKVRLINEEITNDYGANLLRSRGVSDVETYMNPTADLVNNPSLLKNIAAGTAMYLRVVKESGRILLVVDCDMDGFTSSTIFYQYTKRMNPDVQIDYLIHEGKQHGLEDHIDKIMEEGSNYDLLVLPDSSSNDIHYHDMLAEIHLPSLIIDHHITDAKLSDNAIVINNQLSPDYPNKELTGAGMVYQFCRYVDMTTGHGNWADDYVDLAAFGIIGDMANILEPENRYFIYKGLHNIQNKLLWAFMRKQSYSITRIMEPSDDELLAAMNPISVAFYIVPLVNAIQRVGTMDEKIRLFEAFLDADKMIPSGKRGCKGQLDLAGAEAAREATNARSRQNKTLDNVMFSIESKIFKYDLLENKILFIRLEEDDVFPSELNGLVAMKCAAKYKKPTIVARLNNQGYDRGSMRGMNQSAMSSFKDFLESTGCFEYVAGHDNAAGVSISDGLLSHFHEIANEQLKDMDFGENCYDVNFIRDAYAQDLSAIIEDMDKYTGIWGQGNPEALVYVKNIPVKPSNITIMGSKKDTIKIEVNGICYMKFLAKELIDELSNHTGDMILEVVGKPNVNHWGGRSIPQLFIEELQIKDNNPWEF